jgi:hypothetical protein
MFWETLVVVVVLVTGFLAGFGALFLLVQDLKESIMAKFADVSQAIAAINAATNDLSARVTAALEAIKPGITEAEADEVVAELNSVATALAGIAADPNNPIPA